MRNLFILRGVPGSGKSTWIHDNNYQHYTLCADDIRLLFQCPTQNTLGQDIISSTTDRKVWNFIYELLEAKMQQGETIFVDATHCNNKALKQYKSLTEKYRYRAYLVDFMKDDENNVINKDIFLKRNSLRESLKVVPQDVIDRMYESYVHAEKPSTTFKIIKPNDVKNIIYKDILYDFNNWKEIIIFGDIHGCFNPLKEWFIQHSFCEDTMYIFVGDYIDRGLQNDEVLIFLNDLLEKSKDIHNVLLLEGNHENWLKKYLNGDKTFSEEFGTHTLPQLEKLDKHIIKNIVNRLGQLAYFSYNNNIYFVSHGGMPVPPTGLTVTRDLIKGIGEYSELNEVYDGWYKNTPENYIMVHGHRNVQMLTIENGRIYNLNDEIEWGGNLRILQINKSSIKPYTHLIKNDLFKERPVIGSTRPVYNSNNEFIKALNESKLVTKKVLKNGIISYNFSRDVFNDSKWNDLTVKARGLFIDSQTDKIVARSYNKFFNLDERPETELKNLQYKLKFPVTAYKKENGFLGLVSYDKRNNEIFIASKSTNEGPYASYLAEQWYLLPLSIRQKLIEFLKNNDYTLVFEVINQDVDPHIIRYNKNGLYLLDVVKNSFEFDKLSYSELLDFADKYDLVVKKKSYELNNYSEFKNLIDTTEKDINFDIAKFEGWVFEDSDGYMLKYKTPHYRFWKRMRMCKELISNNHEIKNLENFSEKAIDVISFMKKLDINKLNSLSIIDIKELYDAKLKQ